MTAIKNIIYTRHIATALSKTGEAQGGDEDSVMMKDAEEKDGKSVEYEDVYEKGGRNEDDFVAPDYLNDKWD